ncbi:hypothetical protein P5673_004313 [Acropora cervicornis]|uniref:Uncharacterized protein n=1 Tax=Acropora cervicornis TaxID=6130 RepID=A0AAD9R002_ACRCE|nr:hypothetical protein P5673_004313 [Acropora cervicornis]
MATVVADVTLVERLTEQFGHQRLEERFSSRRAESRGSQFFGLVNNVHVKFGSVHPSSWILREKATTISKHKRHTNHGNEAGFASRDVQELFLIDSPQQRISEIRVVKRNLKRIHEAGNISSRAEKESAFDKEKFSTKCRETDCNEQDDASSSSDEELRDLFSRDEKLVTTDMSVGESVYVKCNPLLRPTGSDHASATRRKRISMEEANGGAKQ